METRADNFKNGDHSKSASLSKFTISFLSACMQDKAGVTPF